VAIGTLTHEVGDSAACLPRWWSVARHVERHPTWCRVFLAIWCGLLFFQGLPIGQLWKTEGLRAVVAAEMVRSGNWIVPRLYGEPLFTKPPGTYIAIALASLPFGEVTEVSARLPSALAATLTVLMLYGYFRRCCGRLGGLVIAVLAPMSPMWLDKSTAAEIDMMQVMWVTGAMLCFLRAMEGVEEKGGRGAWQWWMGALLCVSGGVLTKWTAVAFFYATVAPLLWWRGQLRQLFRWQHVLAAVAGASVCLSWIAAAVALEGWDVFYHTVSREALQRMVPSYAPRTDSWYIFVLHPFTLWATNLPWSLVALVACRPSFGHLWDARTRRLWQALHCWIWPNMAIWSLMLDHKARHSFPLFPAIAGLAALVWVAWLTGKLPWRFPWQPRQVLVLSLAAWLLVKAVFVYAVVPHQRASRDPAGKAAILSSLVPDGAVLYLFQVKDECIMFYYGRPVARLAISADLPSSPEPVYCILGEADWGRRHRPASLLARDVAVLTTGLTDEQGDRMWLVRVSAR
jgi:4-amino-4-deoxy-L-arabinose transferase-like glycosyltransferase